MWFTGPIARYCRLRTPPQPLALRPCLKKCWLEVIQNQSLRSYELDQTLTRTRGMAARILRVAASRTFATCRVPARASPFLANVVKRPASMRGLQQVAGARAYCAGAQTTVEVH